MTIRLSVVIPLYRSQQMQPELHRRIVAALDPIEPASEIIFVEDCGGDDSWRVIESLAAQDARARGIKLARNSGQHNALRYPHRARRTRRDDRPRPPEPPSGRFRGISRANAFQVDGAATLHSSSVHHADRVAHHDRCQSAQCRRALVPPSSAASLRAALTPRDCDSNGPRRPRIRQHTGTRYCRSPRRRR